MLVRRCSTTSRPPVRDEPVPPDRTVARPMMLLIGGVVLLVLLGRLVTHGLPSAIPTSGTRQTAQTAPLPPGTQPNGQPRRLQLGRGRITSRYPAQALDPLTNSLTATVRAPADTDLSIFVVTGHGTRLGILTALHGPECRITGRQATCTISEEQAVGGQASGRSSSSSPRSRPRWSRSPSPSSRPARWSEPPRRHRRLGNGSVSPRMSLTYWLI
jgi:hypothetical protein